MKTFILSTLLHHANRTTRSAEFYAIKNRILSKYGLIVGYDVQHIGGKRCFTCDGTGVYRGYWDSGEEWHDTCNRCSGGGWYKWPVWNVLEKRRFGRYTFHQPVKRCYSTEDVCTYLATAHGLAHAEIEGYIEHAPSRYGDWAVLVLFVLYERKLPPYDLGFGMGWRSRWHRPDAWLNNGIHLIRKRTRAIPFDRLKERLQKPATDLRIFHGEISDWRDFPF